MNRTISALVAAVSLAVPAAALAGSQHPAVSAVKRFYQPTGKAYVTCVAELPDGLTPCQAIVDESGQTSTVVLHLYAKYAVKVKWHPHPHVSWDRLLALGLVTTTSGKIDWSTVNMPPENH